MSLARKLLGQQLSAPPAANGVTYADRVLEAKLAAAEHAVQRDARRSDDPRMDLFVAQLSAQRRHIAALGAALDERISLIDRACRALDAGAIAQIRPPFSVGRVR